MHNEINKSEINKMQSGSVMELIQWHIVYRQDGGHGGRHTIITLAHNLTPPKKLYTHTID